MVSLLATVHRKGSGRITIMRKLVLPLLMSSFALPAVAMEQQLVDAWEESLNLPELNAELFDSYNLSANANRRNQQQQRKRKNPWFHKDGPKRTRFFSGFEFTETTYDNAPRQGNFVKILADGSTKIHPNWRIRYVLNQIDSNKGKDGEEPNGPRQNMILAPRYEKWVSPRFSYWSEVMFRQSLSMSGSNNGARGTRDNEYKVKAGGNWNRGRNNFNATIEYGYRENEFYEGDSWALEKRTNYVTSNFVGIGWNHRLNQRMNTGLRLEHNDTHNDQKGYNTTLKAHINYRFNNGVRTEFNIVKGDNGARNNDNGYKNTNYNLNTNFPINDTFNGIFNVAYREGKRYHDGNTPGWGDRRAVFTKIGVNVAF